MAKCLLSEHGSNLEDFPCVYCIRSSVTGEMYVGSTCSCAERYRFHKSHLNGLTHKNSNMVRHVKEHGLGDLEFIILEKCTQERLREVEQWFYDNLKPSFNITGPIRKRIGKVHSSGHGNEGEGNGNSKLGRKEVLGIRNSNLTCKELSLLYDISTTQVWMVRSFKSYKNIK